MRPRVAIVGAGPAGAYTAAALLRSRHRVLVDLFERLPTPWGLLRGGVAPDHQEIKTLAGLFSEEVMRPGCRFFGDVEVGKDVRHDDLAAHYTAIVYAVGAQADRTLGVPREDLPGSLPATAFVGWYNGHPDRADLAVDLDCERAVVIGNGNVAADVARVLARDPESLARTDIADPALAALRASRVREVVVVGRRGPAQAAFTSAELRELGHLTGVDVFVEAGEARTDHEPASFTAATNVALVRAFADRPATGAARRIVLRFRRAPVRILGDERVTGIELARTELSEDGSRATPTDDVETIDCGLVLRSVGYRPVPIPGVPFDEADHVLPNEAGRVAPGVYAVGWIKRGPTGILGTNKRDAAETVRSLLADWEAGALDGRRADGVVPAGHVSFDGWRAIDGHEVAAGLAAGRPRVKRSTRSALLAAARGAV